MRIRWIQLIALLAVALLAGKASAQTTAPANKSPTNLKFSFGKTPLPGHVHVVTDAKYTPERGYGFDLESRVADNAGFASGQDNKPFFFAAKLSPGAYKVTITLG